MGSLSWSVVLSVAFIAQSACHWLPKRAFTAEVTYALPLHHHIICYGVCMHAEAATGCSSMPHSGMTMAVPQLPAYGGI
jgi:hypothetical protein